MLVRLMIDRDIDYSRLREIELQAVNVHLRRKEMETTFY